jgi:hypothetical protein
MLETINAQIDTKTVVLFLDMQNKLAKILEEEVEYASGPSADFSCQSSLSSDIKSL